MASTTTSPTMASMAGGYWMGVGSWLIRCDSKIAMLIAVTSLPMGLSVVLIHKSLVLLGPYGSLGIMFRNFLLHGGRQLVELFCNRIIAV